MLKKVRNILTVIFITICLSILFSGKVSASDGSLYLDKLDFQATIHSDGSMDVVETWDIDIRYTNTLYKTFKMLQLK